MFRTKNCGELSVKNVDEEVTLCGWVDSHRDHGGIIFIDLRDRYGKTQIVFDPKVHKDSHEIAEKLRSEWVIQIFGKVKARGEGLKNPNLKTGEIEVFVNKINVLNESKTPPFELDKDIRNEDLRLKYRYLDLRREKMQKNIILRHKMCQVIRKYFDKQDFVEIETPILVKGTPEGSREYLVPSRLHPSQFYVLPQSPQQLKQLLMVSGFDKYFQIARCFRDEDQRGDRQPEFTQFEIEMSFVEQKDVIDAVEFCFHELTKECAPQKNWKKFLENERFIKFTWQEAMEKYGSDKPDIRFDLSFENISDLASDSGFKIFENSKFLFALKVSKNLGQFSRKDIDDLTETARIHGAGGLAWLRVGEDSGPVAKNTSKKFLDSLLNKTDAKDGDIIFFGANNDFIDAVEPLGAVRLAIGDKFELRNIDDFAFCWVVDFPMYEKKEDGTMQAAHHPFTRPHEEDLNFLTSDPLKVRSHAYDVVLNGVELGGGSIRIHDPKLQRKIFDVFDMTEDEVQLKFGHLMKAFQYGCPPHGGCAMGLDRVVMMWADEPNIREVIAFPKNQSAQDLMLGAPSVMPEKEILEQNIKIIEEEK